eukprot:TRINITY_DN1609_c0_g1_i1.p1 TRINITY_DN1609_c0_g1~~TRINITY_DN1609_c0_g1_i1.p1  ORF type:complete len:248 (+),score=30.86 TRINITY_DN1609_c0_g1_i1:159-902(+)
MPLVGIYASSNLENVASIDFPDSAVWTIEVCKARSSRIPSPPESMVVSKDAVGTVEWRGIKGVDRISCDRKERQASMRILRDGGAKALCGDKCLVAVLDCQGCEPQQLVSVGPVIINTTGGRAVYVDTLDFAVGWADTCNGVSCSALVTVVDFGAISKSLAAGRNDADAETALASSAAKRCLRRERKSGFVRYEPDRSRDKPRVPACREPRQNKRNAQKSSSKCSSLRAPIFAGPLLLTCLASACAR